MPNNIETRNAAKEIVQNSVRRQLSEEGKRSAQTLAAIFDGVIVPLFNKVNAEMNRMEFHIDQEVEQLPKGLWDKLSKNKRLLFLAEMEQEVARINKSQNQMGQMIDEYRNSLDKLSPEALDQILELQVAITKAMQPKFRKPRASRKKSLATAAA